MYCTLSIQQNIILYHCDIIVTLLILLTEIEYLEEDLPLIDKLLKNTEDTVTNELLVEKKNNKYSKNLLFSCPNSYCSKVCTVFVFKSIFSVHFLLFSLLYALL